jgi:hypothetical protein
MYPPLRLRELVDKRRGDDEHQSIRSKRQQRLSQRQRKRRERLARRQQLQKSQRRALGLARLSEVQRAHRSRVC